MLKLKWPVSAHAVRMRPISNTEGPGFLMLRMRCLMSGCSSLHSISYHRFQPKRLTCAIYLVASTKKSLSHPLCSYHHPHTGRTQVRLSCPTKTTQLCKPSCHTLTLSRSVQTRLRPVSWFIFGSLDLPASKRPNLLNLQCIRDTRRVPARTVNPIG